MARKGRSKEQIEAAPAPDPRWLDLLNSAEPLKGVPGPGRWLVIRYQPTSLFSLKTSQATSSVGVTLVIPTPYAIKMAFVDAAFRTGYEDVECAKFLRSLVKVDVRVAPARIAVVTNTFQKVRKEPKKKDRLRPYISSIAYRELVYFDGTWLWAFDLAGCDYTTAEMLVRLGPHVNYVGKRGSFVQFLKNFRLVGLDARFTQPMPVDLLQILPPKVHVRLLDDFGPEARLEVLSSFTTAQAKADKHRKFVETIIPTAITNIGPGFSEYSAE